MASYKKDGEVWRVQIARKGVRLSGTFPTKRAAEAWATERENEILKGTYRGAGFRTVGDLFSEYADRVSEGKPGARWEQTRFKAFRKNFPTLAGKLLVDTTSHDWGLWRDERLKSVSAGTVIREINLFSHAFTTARDEWKWLSESPLSGMRRPKEPKSRDRRVSQDEFEKMRFALGYPGNTVSARVWMVFEFAIETMCRASEICLLEPNRVFQRHIHLDKTKNGDARDVPLSMRARELIEEARALSPDAPTVFNVTSSQLDALFRKARDRCAINDLHFHDSRHEAITRMAKKLQILDLARAAGIRDLKILMVYYNETAHDMAERLG
jgi:integrase